MNKELLLSVARACREADPEEFTMERYSNQHYKNGAFVCSTPACALGNLAARQDLQQRLALAPSGWLGLDGTPVDCDSPAMCELFDLEQAEMRELFGSFGCGGKGHYYDDSLDELVDDEVITDPIKAAEYIENFVARKEQKNAKSE